jgi:hypothetical protein
VGGEWTAAGEAEGVRVKEGELNPGPNDFLAVATNLPSVQYMLVV